MRAEGAYNMGRTIKDFKKIYEDNLELLKEFYKLRRLFGVALSDNFSRGLAFLIDETHKEHPLRWKHYLHKLIKESLKHGSPGYKLFLGIKIRELDIEKFRKENKLSINYRRSLNIKKEGLERYKSALENKAKKFHFSAVSFIPEWFVVSSVGMSVYQREVIEEPLIQIENRELIEDNKKLQRIHNIHRLYFESSFNKENKYLKKEFRQLKKMCKLIKKEIGLRKDLQHSIKKLEKKIGRSIKPKEELKKDIKKILEEQLHFWENILFPQIEESLYYVPNPTGKKLIRENYFVVQKLIKEEL